MNSLESYFLREIPTIFRAPKGCFQHPYLVPGGTYEDEMWDWDSFWITKGLMALTRQVSPETAEEFVLYARGCWLNFFALQAANGAVPIMATSYNADFFQSAALPNRNQAKPVFGQFALEITEYTGDVFWVAPHFDGLMKFYSRWITEYGTESGLLVWGSDLAIGVDNDPTTYGRPEFSSANLLLNCLFYRDVMAARELAIMLGRDGQAEVLHQWAKKVGDAVRRECWDEKDGFFYTVDVQCADTRDKFIPHVPRGMDMTWRTLPLKVKVFTGFLPMWCGLASREQARVLVERHLRNENEFQAPYGIRTLSKDEPMYDPVTNSGNPSNWLGPVWIVSNYMVYEGLQRYGFDTDAEILGQKTRALLEGDLQVSGTSHEYYHPETGAPNFNAGFLNWNLLASLMTGDEAKAVQFEDETLV